MRKDDLDGSGYQKKINFLGSIRDSTICGTCSGGLRLRNLRGVLITHKSGFGYFYGSSVRQFYCSAVLNSYKKVKNCFKQAGTAEQRNRKTVEPQKFSTDQRYG